MYPCIKTYKIESVIKCINYAPSKMKPIEICSLKKKKN